MPYRKSHPFKWLGRLNTDGSLILSNDSALCHRLGSETSIEIYRPAHARLEVIELRDVIHTKKHEGTIICKEHFLEEEHCLSLALLIRRLHYRLAEFTGQELVTIPTYFLVDEGETEMIEPDYELINSLDELRGMSKSHFLFPLSSPIQSPVSSLVSENGNNTGTVFDRVRAAVIALESAGSILARAETAEKAFITMKPKAKGNTIVARREAERTRINASSAYQEALEHLRSLLELQAPTASKAKDLELDSSKSNTLDNQNNTLTTTTTTVEFPMDIDNNEDIVVEGGDKKDKQEEDQEMNLDTEGFIANKLKKKKKAKAKPSAASIEADKQRLTKHLEILHNCLRQEGLSQEIIEGFEAAIMIDESDDEDGDEGEDMEIEEGVVGSSSTKKEGKKEGGEGDKDQLSETGIIKRNTDKCPTEAAEKALKLFFEGRNRYPGSIKATAQIGASLKGNGRKRQQDGKGSRFSLQGVSFAVASTEINKAPNALSCGCDIEEALLDFIFFKTATLISRNPALANILR
ncbi:hypothetical protein R3P38DRAFT_2774896 [Favolaschia claudopus]|uniref:Uncharacterized protein n=1 Tax=Favolaschia claudopus TaxID=2862362 RepID=A0AAW0BWS5_9AGAR